MGMDRLDDMELNTVVGGARRGSTAPKEAERKNIVIRCCPDCKVKGEIELFSGGRAHCLSCNKDIYI